MKYLLLFSVICIVLILSIYDFESFTIDTNLEDDLDELMITYGTLMNDFNLIFQDRNRNAGGVQFFHHIHNKRNVLTKDKYLSHHKVYCAVSGSPIKPHKNNKDKIVVKGLDNKEYIGDYYRCCWPCLCDIMKYVRLEEHSVELADGILDYHVLVIGDPCIKEEEIPDEITSFKCKNNETANGTKTKNGNLIIGVLHNVKEYDSNLHNIDDVNNKCKDRMNTEPENLKGGMGDIFVLLSLINPLSDHGSLQCYV